MTRSQRRANIEQLLLPCRIAAARAANDRAHKSKRTRRKHWRVLAPRWQPIARAFSLRGSYQEFWSIVICLGSKRPCGGRGAPTQWYSGGGVLQHTPPRLSSCLPRTSKKNNFASSASDRRHSGCWSAAQRGSMLGWRQGQEALTGRGWLGTLQQSSSGGRA